MKGLIIGMLALGTMASAYAEMGKCDYILDGISKFDRDTTRKECVDLGRMADTSNWLQDSWCKGQSTSSVFQLIFDGQEIYKTNCPSKDTAYPDRCEIRINDKWRQMQNVSNRKACLEYKDRGIVETLCRGEFDSSTYKLIYEGQEIYKTHCGQNSSNDTDVEVPQNHKYAVCRVIVIPKFNVAYILGTNYEPYKTKRIKEIKYRRAGELKRLEEQAAELWEKGVCLELEETVRY
jgi:hypothetical protein